MSLYPFRHLKTSIAGALRLSCDMDLLKALGFNEDETAKIIMDVAREESALPRRTTNAEHGEMLHRATERWTP